ncbi:hypothetical protein B0T25DRAFT_611690 [Lasiosphaeria hispida]|uniref:Uncharacterized protein n=1 Tax=Lasiosphaeria hispida TaxID=260671 RepID=A0AAJ0HA79_9PEZI|nr:hypothetical protein B0T25DRAFT_611690 [Lasiosphaeria hispida]
MISTTSFGVIIDANAAAVRVALRILVTAVLAVAFLSDTIMTMRPKILLVHNKDVPILSTTGWLSAFDAVRTLWVTRSNPFCLRGIFAYMILTGALRIVSDLATSGLNGGPDSSLAGIIGFYTVPFEARARVAANAFEADAVNGGVPSIYWSVDHASRNYTTWLVRFQNQYMNREDQWSIHRRLPFPMVAMFLAGVCFAFGHHEYYTARNGDIVESSEWPVRFGIALAFLAQQCFVGSAQVAYKQYSWRTLKKKCLKIDTIDRVFAASREPTEAFSAELVFKAPSLTLIALLCWLLPLCAVATPSTPIAVPSSTSSTEICKVASLNFSRDNGLSWDAIGAKKVEFCYWEFGSKTNKWYYDGPTYEFQQLSNLWWSSTEALVGSSPCRAGANCTYDISFDGPAIKCDERADFDGTTGQSLEDLPPSGTSLYTGSMTETGLDTKGRPLEWLKDNQSYGVFTREYPTWIGYVLECNLHHAKYTVAISYLDGRQVVNRALVEHRGPVLPRGGSMYPENSTYGQFGTYHVMGFHFNQHLSNLTSSTNYNVWSKLSSDISQTTLVDHISQLPVLNFPRALEKKFSDLVLSMLSQSQANLNQRITISSPCTIASPVQRWEYHPLWVGISYGLAASLSLLAMVAGGYAIRQHGYATDSRFSTLLATTRNAEIDALMSGYSLGSAPLPERILQSRLQFGEVQVVDVGRGTDGSGGAKTEKHAAFGSGERVRPIVFGERYF